MSSSLVPVLLAVAIGSLFGSAVYHLLDRNVQRIAIGLALLAHGTNLLILSMGGFHPAMRFPLTKDGRGLFADPLPQALILTAIVIGFGMLAFFLALTVRLYRQLQEDEVSSERPWKEP